MTPYSWYGLLVTHGQETYTQLDFMEALFPPTCEDDLNDPYEPYVPDPAAIPATPHELETLFIEAGFLIGTEDRSWPT